MKETIGLVVTVVLFWWAVGFIVGSADAGFYESHSVCKKYESYAEYSNIGYIAGCELFKERFNQ